MRRQADILRKAGSAAILCALVFFSIFGIIAVQQYIGYASFAGKAGNIYELVLKHHIPVTQWSGLYGVAVRVDGYGFQQSTMLEGGELENENLLFDCLAPDADHEVYASIYPPATLDLGSVTPANPSEVDALYNLNATGVDSAQNTLVSSVTLEIGQIKVTAPGAYTYKLDETGTPSTFGMAALKDAAGRIFFGTTLTNFTAGFNGDILNYQMILPLLQNQTSTRYWFFTDPNDVCPAGEGTEPLQGSVAGNVTSQSGVRLANVIVEVAGDVALSSLTGSYNLSPQSGSHKIYAISEGYVPYVNNLTVSPNETIFHDIVMIEEVVNPNTGPGIDSAGENVGVGPGQSDGEGPGEAPAVPFVEQPKRIEGTDYIISLSEIKRKIRIDTFHQEALSIYSFKKSPVALDFRLHGENLSGIVTLDRQQVVVEPNDQAQVVITLWGRPPTGVYEGNITIDGEINATIPVEIEILPKDKIPVEALLVNLETNQKRIFPGEAFKFKTDLRNLLVDQGYPVSLLFTIQPIDGNETVWSYGTNVFLKTAFSLIRTVEVPKDLPPGDYVLRANANYLDLASSTSTIFYVDVPFWRQSLFGFAFWIWGIVVCALLASAVAGFLVYRNAQGKKKYHLKVELSELPKPGPRNVFVGKIAETEHKTYMNLENFKVHTIVAGSTGGGKSVSAQVIVEEALEKDVAVICFDPTAQWTGMLRPCKDKTMLSLYSFFGMKKSDAKAYNGNIRMITDPREVIDIKKYVRPGEIQIFACNKLDPKDMDIVVANAIREIFHANFPESKPLKVLFVFDEVHRLLPKFGGSGDGFLQIERACREFRKWGLGVVLVSQVLSDFMGTIKANINTEVQMRTRDEGDLERVRQKYGEEVLRSLVKATVGSGMVENPAYNRGRPYFVAFRPLKHSVERLPDEEIEEYNKYNDLVDDLEYSLDQLEAEGVDAFDLKLELKLALDKVKQGNFNMVKIYLEGLTPRIDKQWEKIGKKPKPLVRKTVSEEALKEELHKAQAERDEYVKGQKKEEVSEKKQWQWGDNAPPDKILNLKNGMVVLSLASLYDELSAIKDKDFEEQGIESLASWVESATGLARLAGNMRAAGGREAILKILEKFKNGEELPEVKQEARPGKQEAPAQAETQGADREEAAEKQPQDTVREKREPAQPEVGPATPQDEKPAPPAASLERLVTDKPEEFFRLENGMQLKSAKELADYLPRMDEDVFRKHVGEDYNHFADWIRGVFGNDELASRIGRTHTREEMQEALGA